MPPAKRLLARLNLTTRLTVGMIALVVVAVAAVGVIGYRNIETTVVPRALSETALQASLAAASLDAAAASLRGDVLGFRADAALDGIVRATLNGGVHPRDGTPVEVWRQRMERRFVAELAAKPLYTQFRIIGVADGRREIVRVDRAGADGAIRIVPPAELQRKGDRGYFRETLLMVDGEVYVSPVELNQERGELERPVVPVLRAAAPVHTPDGKPFGMVIINLDLRPAFDRIRAAEQFTGRIYVVNEQGDYLVHPEPEREFGFEFGTPHRVQDDLPGLGAALADIEPKPAIVKDESGERFGVAVASVRLAGGPLVSVIDAVPYSSMLESSRAVRDTSLYVGLGAALLAIILAIVLARSLTRPLVRMTRAVERFAQGDSIEVPTDAHGEIGVLARAFERMANEVNQRAAELRRSAEIFDIIMTSMADRVVLVDERARLVYANPAAKALWITEITVGAANWEDALLRFRADGETPLPREEWPIDRAVRGEAFDDVELVFGLARGRKATALVSGRPIRDASGALAGAVLIYHDITKAKEAERQLARSQRMDAIGQLTGGVAHDFNNILTVISGSIEMLSDGVADRPKLANLAKMIERAAGRGANLTRQLLAFARRQPLQPEETDVNALVNDTTKLLGPTLGEHIEIEARLDEAAWRAIIDPSLLSTALLNLAVNARDAMPQGGKLTLETRNVVLDEPYAEANAEVRPGPYVMIAVSDTGTGIPPALQDKVFEPFFTTKEIGRGTGLGLSMVYGFVKQSGGHIKVYSEEGLGTTIKLYLPRVPLHADAAEARAPEAVPQGGGQTILVVEDDEMVRSTVTVQLEALGYVTLAARDGSEALALVDKGARFDLLFTDIVMPGGMNGRQLADALARRNPSLKVLYTSGYTENAIIHHGRLDPGVVLLNKPYRKEDLARKINEALNATRPSERR